MHNPSIPTKLHYYSSLPTPSSGSLSHVRNFERFNYKVSRLTFVLILLSLPEQTSLDFTIKCVLPPAIHVFYMGKIIESVFPTLFKTFLLTFIFYSLLRQVSKKSTTLF